MESLWEQTDRQKQRDELDLAAFLQMLEEKQRALGSRPGRWPRPAIAQTPRGPAGGRNGPAKAGRRDPAAEGEDRSHAEQGGPIVARRDGRRGSPAPAVSADELKRAIAQSAIDGGRGRNGDRRRGRETSCGQAVRGRQAANRRGREVQSDVSQRGAVSEPGGPGDAAQQGLVDATPPGDGRGEGDGKKAPLAKAQRPLAERNETGRTNPRPCSSPAGRRVAERESKEAAWNQEFVTHYGEILAPLAKEGLKQLEATPVPAAPAGPPSSNRAAPALHRCRRTPETARRLKRSMEKAVELGPKVEKLSGEAVQLLRDRKPAEALPKQQEALKLLKEIAEPLPKQDPKQDQNKQNQNQSGSEQARQEAAGQARRETATQTGPERAEAEPATRGGPTAGGDADPASPRAAAEAAGNGKAVAAILIRPGNVDKDW